MAITAALVKELRERTGAGMMECKKMLTQTNGDIEAAIEEMRKNGAAQADKKAGRIAAEGTIVTLVDGNKGVAVEVNSETDFSAKDEFFVEFANQVAAAVMAAQPADLEALSAASVAGGKTVEEARQALIQKIGENITVRRFELVEAGDSEIVGAYQHGNKISVLTRLSNASEELAKDIAMHVAASRPVCISADEVPAELLEKEREIFSAQAAESGKPAEIMEKMVDGRIRKYLNEVTLLGQSFVKDPDQTVEKLLKSAGAEVKQFVRYEVGEGIEKKEDDFVSEVMAQAGKA
ncbi:translation elongation factor Ts [Arenicella xantha]|uniref:Elongation factor Ts n=1 Tax=Arenicella xantha TaxID=644221 RepID=A0A395JMU4_9GAMM|nr:translation elongation factor Ts [Arenicella xantha]RBP50948.1 elongation factor Ts [Arenicella xantha]